MIVELHLLQNFVPSNLNRDDTGSPKDCEFGGVRRARISSQCLKRAVRTSFAELELLPPEARGMRTKRLADALAEDLEAQGREPEVAKAVAISALAALGLKVEEDGKTQYLVFLGQAERQKLVEVCGEHWDALAKGASGGADAKNAKAAKKAAKDSFDPAVKKALEQALDGGKAADLALFGRMLADLPQRNVDAASQVAHALSTHRLSQEFDYYTAVDDRKPDDTQGADMIGTVDFNSACYYRYLNVDTRQLEANLGGDSELAQKALEAYLKAAIRAIPTGKQNSMAAHNPPSFVMATVRENGPMNLANAFVKPVTAGQHGLSAASVVALDQHWGQLTKMYGEEGLKVVAFASLGDEKLEHLHAHRKAGVSELLAAVLGALR